MAKLFEVTLSDGFKMKGNSWLIENGKANYVFITGMQEYSMRYDRMANFMNEKGINVWVLDHIGQGENAKSVEEQQQWCVNAFDKIVEGLYLTIELAKQNGLPTVQGGHSMGSFMTQARLERYPEAASKTIIVGSNGGQGFLMSMGYFLAKLMVNKKNWDKPNKFLSNLGLGGYSKAIKNRKTDLDWLSYNEENVQKYIADPYCGHPNTSGFWKEFLKGMRLIWKGKEMKKIHKGEKVFITSGSEDPVGQNGKGLKWLEKKYQELGVDVRLKLYEHMRHEIHNEDNYLEVYNDWVNFILK